MEKDFQIVAFQVGNELFGLPITVVREIVRVPEITAVPTVPEHIEGVINLRGQIIPVMDLPKRFGVGSGERSPKDRVVVVELAGRRVGLIVHSASEVLRVAQAEIEAVREVLPDSGVNYVSGVAKVKGRLVILLDLQKITERGVLSEFGNASEFLETVAAVRDGQEG